MHYSILLIVITRAHCSIIGVFILFLLCQCLHKYSLPLNSMISLSPFMKEQRVESEVPSRFGRGMFSMYGGAWHNHWTFKASLYGEWVEGLHPSANHPLSAKTTRFQYFGRELFETPFHNTFRARRTLNSISTWYTYYTLCTGKDMLLWMYVPSSVTQNYLSLIPLRYITFVGPVNIFIAMLPIIISKLNWKY